MFTGIIETVGEVVAKELREGDVKLTLKADESYLEAVMLGDSIACNGVCLTVTHIHKKTYRVNCVKETLDKTNLGKLKVGDKINLERSLKVNDRNSGHFVQGHVDCSGKCIHINKVEGNIYFRFKYPKKFFWTFYALFN